MSGVRSQVSEVSGPKALNLGCGGTPGGNLSRSGRLAKGYGACCPGVSRHASVSGRRALRADRPASTRRGFNPQQYRRGQRPVFFGRRCSLHASGARVAAGGGNAGSNSAESWISHRSRDAEIAPTDCRVGPNSERVDFCSSKEERPLVNTSLATCGLTFDP